MKSIIHQGDLLIDVAVDVPGFLEVSLLDNEGQLVYNHSDYVNEGKFNYKIEKRLIDRGEYFLRIAKNGISEVKKFNIA